MREKKLYYIKGSKENPEGVRQALLEVCPDAKNPDNLTFKNECGLYYILDNTMYFCDWCHSATAVVERFGTELQPKTQEKFVEKTMYQRVFKDGFEDIHGSNRYYSTIEDAMAGEHSIGYKEVKVMIKE